MNSKTDFRQIQDARERVREALTAGDGDSMRAALQSCLQLFDTLADEPKVDRSSEYAGSIDYTFEDEEYEPIGREVDVRVYYSWYDYDSADEPSPVWGATVEDLEVLAIRHFDNDGNEVGPAEHDLEVAWQLLNKRQEEVTEACTEDGYRNGVGAAPTTYTPQHALPHATAPGSTSFADCMAASLPTRESRKERRRLG